VGPGGPGSGYTPGWKVKYLSELQLKGGELVVKELPVAKMG